MSEYRKRPYGGEKIIIDVEEDGEGWSVAYVCDTDAQADAWIQAQVQPREPTITSALRAQIEREFVERMKRSTPMAHYRAMDLRWGWIESQITKEVA